MALCAVRITHGTFKTWTAYLEYKSSERLKRSLSKPYTENLGWQ